jgi:hypothetical protein
MIISNVQMNSGVPRKPATISCKRFHSGVQTVTDLNSADTREQEKVVVKQKV